ncbi:hypothetical protein GCM10022206_61880 [Streptomyces chiangmaiensis]
MCCTASGNKLDGTLAAGDTYKGRRRALNTALEHAVVVGELPENPLLCVRRNMSAPATWWTAASS